MFVVQACKIQLLEYINFLNYQSWQHCIEQAYRLVKMRDRTGRQAAAAASFFPSFIRDVLSKVSIRCSIYLGLVCLLCHAQRLGCFLEAVFCMFGQQIQYGEWLLKKCNGYVLTLVTQFNNNWSIQLFLLN